MTEVSHSLVTPIALVVDPSLGVSLFVMLVVYCWAIRQWASTKKEFILRKVRIEHSKKCCLGTRCIVCFVMNRKAFYSAWMKSATAKTETGGILFNSHYACGFESELYSWFDPERVRGSMKNDNHKQLFLPRVCGPQIWDNTLPSQVRVRRNPVVLGLLILGYPDFWPRI